jgi:hypothetical protein
MRNQQPRVLGRFLLSFGLVAALLAAVPSVALAGTLVGETFATTHFSSGSSGCPTPNTGRVIYFVDGLATGPFSGPFEERGDLHMSGGSITDWSVTFTIYDPTGNFALVTGTKTLAGTATGTCSTAFNGDTLYATATGALSYDALFTADDTTETGPSSASVSFVNPSDLLTGTFVEGFGPPTNAAPRTKDECKDCGYASFPMFQNQGQCIAFVNHLP